jgi:hypothetical protein
MRTRTLAIILAASLIAASAQAQQSSTGTTSLPAECAELGPALDEQTINAISDMSERLQALSCMVGTPRDYQAELATRSSGSTPQAINVEEAFGNEVVARGLEQSAEANAAVTGPLQTAVAQDPMLTQYLRSQGHEPAEVIGYFITPGATYIYLAPEWSRQNQATGSTGSSGN